MDSPCARDDQPTLRARYPGSLTIERDDDGSMSVLVTLPFERYLEGIAEMPPSWPAAALDAQAIAARSYALATTGWTGEGDTLESPICSTASCQVYGGIPVPKETQIRRWYAAVRRTRGEMLVSDGRPIEAVYFSTSNGHTYGNEDVFGSAPLPYLRPRVERDDRASPTSRWRATVPFGDLSVILAAADAWSHEAAIRRAQANAGTVRLVGSGTRRTITVDDLRADINTWAPCLFPKRYPGDSRFGTSLPLTVPSGWSKVIARTNALVFTGRGWGHGVGMVQWGARGKALHGWPASRILGFYYGGLQPQQFPEPGLIDVDVASGLSSICIVPSGAGAHFDGEPLPRAGIAVTGGGQLDVTQSLTNGCAP